MNFGRTHSSSAMAFREHVDYSCALHRFDRRPHRIRLVYVTAWALVLLALFVAAR